MCPVLSQGAAEDSKLYNVIIKSWAAPLLGAPVMTALWRQLFFSFLVSSSAASA